LPPKSTNKTQGKIEMSDDQQNTEKTPEQGGQVNEIVIRRLVKKWHTEMNKIWDEWQWYLNHRFPLDAQLKYELKEQLRRKISELENTIECIK